MDWNSKWDWFGSKATNITKKPQLMDWKIIDDGGWFNLSAVSSTKSSMSASTISSIKNGMPTPYFELPSVEGFSGNLGTKMEIRRTEVPEAAEPLIGLKLGKRTYFESNVSVMPTPPTNLLKRTKSTSQNIPTPRCVVQDCSADLSMGKEYHRKHRVCESHSKCPKVIVGGLERRFCQQCSRFHSLSEFDEKKRSCRKRLSDHNARRRKPPRETIQCSSARLSSPFDGERQQLNYLPNYSPLVCSRSSADTAWDTKHKSKFTLPKGYYSKSNINMHTNERLLASMSSIPQMFIPGSKGPPISSPEYSRALSLLSNGEPQNTSLLYQPIPVGVPLSSPDFWLRPAVSDNNFQETPLLVTPFEADLFSNILN